MGSTADKLTYLNTTKEQLKTKINSLGGSITANTPFRDYVDALDDISGGGGYPPDWSEIGYTDTPSSIITNFNYAKQIQNNWDSSVTSMASMFYNNLNLNIMPLVDTSNVTTMQDAFGYCSHLESIPLLDTSKVESFYGTFNFTNLKTIPAINTESATYMRSMFEDCTHLVSVPLMSTENVGNMNRMFAGCTDLVTIPEFSTMVAYNMQGFVSGCSNLSNQSLNNILGMCANATEISESNRKTSYIGLSSQYSSILPTLSNYQSFISAGWTVNT